MAPSLRAVAESASLSDTSMDWVQILDRCYFKHFFMIGMDLSLYRQVINRGSVNRIKNHIQAHAPGVSRYSQNKTKQNVPKK